ncbi:hypothetical protein GE21DRAFT_3722 [Neurospora crassa]|uniref:NACHT domain-containing protein n=1 Tax=Neurospora crassa (strain ATCC 24698 / 74-OR23-1A / CBS 708.71 / DSM 1257 / FGSC 987) TaxID=367110 RepID=V5INU1_NEUCR|nr:uncharacterized protein NCU09760 [Neurospora crassa OR74A]ESA43732.1 hypothetical protein, variant [Neurospora crassa OR74A]KHE85605.1 hypothetical protein GE21DRAFT_3722 [Neurospora crassa]|eukprot:XP_011393650.1 uncharacterized protein NCU09760 [Neurospora crassa OR74A]
MPQAQRPDGFTRALAKFKQGLDPSLAQQFSISTLEDVRVLADKIQHEQGPQGKLRHLQRLEPFIEAMTQLGTVIEVFTNACDFICFIWLAKTHLDSLNKLLEAYGKIASSIPGMERYKEAFQSHPPLAQVLEDYYSDILNFHERAIEVFRRPNWKMLFDAAWKRFDSKFGPVLQSLESRRALLDSEKASATLFQIHQALEEIKENGREQADVKRLVEELKHEQQKELIKKRLDPPNYLRDHEQLLREKAPDSGQWIFAYPRYRVWHNSSDSGSRILYVHGKPGGGKSTLISTVIEQLLGNKTAGAAVAFFYFRQSQEDASRGSLNNLLRALLYQLIDQDPDLTDWITSMSGNDRLRLSSTNVLQDLVCKGVGTQTALYLVLDGLDECRSGEEETIIKWLLGLSQSVLGLRIIVAGQRDDVTDGLLSSQASISLDTSIEHHRDITAYCQKGSEKICRDFDAEPSLEKTMVELVSRGAKGMFLYAKIVLEYLLDQTSVHDLEEQLKPGVFPESLEEAYKKVDERVFEKSARPRSAAASEILSYVISCKRTLFWREIQAFFCIDASKGEVVHKKLMIKSYKELCSSFLDSNSSNKNYTGPEDEVVLVHETAREFLIRKNRVNIHELNSRLSVFCFQYLTSPPFTLGVSDEDVLSHAKKGYYALQDYTVQYWFDHVLECINSFDPISDRYKCQEVFNLARIFLKSYGNRGEMAELLRAETYTAFADAMTQHLPTHGQERNSFFCIDIRTESLRQKIAKLDFGAFTAEEQKVFVNLHGSRTLYKCSKPWCDLFKGGLASEANRRKHIDEHEFPHRCAYDDCMGFKLGFSTEDELQKHNTKWHTHRDDANSFPKFPKLELSPSSSGNSSESSLHEACGRGDVWKVKQLLETDVGKKEIDCQKPTTYGWRYPLEVAAEMGHKDICDLLIFNGANVNINNGAPLRGAARKGHLEACKLLISNGASVDISFGRPLREAAEKGHLEVCKLLISNGASVDILKELPLREAAKKGHLAICELLISNGANVNISSGAPLQEAAWNGQLAICELLIQRGADIKSMGGIQSLHDAAKHGDIKIVDLLLHQDGIEPNKSHQGSTAAEAAAAAGQISVLRLMEASGKVDMSISVNLLRSACKNRSIATVSDTIQYLLSNGYADQADETCAWRILGDVAIGGTEKHIAKVELVFDMLLSTANPVFSDIKRLTKELGYNREKKQKRTPFLISIMEYPKWRTKRSAWSEFLEKRKEFEIKWDDELEEAVDKFVKRIEDNRSTTIVEDPLVVWGKGKPLETARETDEDMEEEMDEEDDLS